MNLQVADVLRAWVTTWVLRFGSVRLALPAVSFDDVSVGAVRFGAPSLPTSRWQVGGRGGRGGRWGGKGEVGMEVGGGKVGGGKVGGGR